MGGLSSSCLLTTMEGWRAYSSLTRRTHQCLQCQTPVAIQWNRWEMPLFTSIMSGSVLKDTFIRHLFMRKSRCRAIATRAPNLFLHALEALLQELGVNLPLAEFNERQKMLLRLLSTSDMTCFRNLGLEGCWSPSLQMNFQVFFSSQQFAGSATKFAGFLGKDGMSEVV